MLQSDMDGGLLLNVKSGTDSPAPMPHLFQSKPTTMRYRAPLLQSDGTLGDHYQVLTHNQLAKFAVWSLETGKSVSELMVGLMVEDDVLGNHHNGTYNVIIEGILPNCGLHGCMLPDGSTHT